LAVACKRLAENGLPGVGEWVTVVLKAEPN